jgi:site-specific recombinase XerD
LEVHASSGNDDAAIESAFTGWEMDTNYEEMRAEFSEHLNIRNASPATIHHYTYGLQTYFDFLASKGIKDVRRADTQTLKAYYLHLQNTLGKKFWSVCLKIRAVKRFYVFLSGEGGFMVLNPAEKLKEPRIVSRIPRNVLTREEAVKVLEQADLTTAKGIMDRAIMETFYSSGIRLAEMEALTVSDVDLAEGMLRIQGKGQKERMVPIGPHAVKLITAYLTRVRPELAKSQGSAVNHSLWLNREGLPLSSAIISRRISEYGKAAKIGKRVTPHVWRHSCATSLVRAGADIVHVQKLLGHSPRTDTSIYCRVAGKDSKASHNLCHPRNLDKEPDKQPKPKKLYRRKRG